jgi:DNA invertase Pin-like site-specific DNA recombinase
MKIGYARTSTLEQEAGFDAQTRELTAAGCEKIFAEQTSSVGQRRELDAALDFIREGDVLVISKMDRLARSTTHLAQIMEGLKTKGANLQILNLGVDTSTPTGKLVFDVMGAIAEFERAMMLERQREGIAKAKADGKYKGRAPTAQKKAADVIQLFKAGVKPSEIARRLEIGRSSVYRMLEA